MFDTVLVLASLLALTWLGIFLRLAYVYGQARASRRNRRPYPRM